jgi:hypothetical protein
VICILQKGGVFRDLNVCIRFCSILGITATETYRMLKHAFRDEMMGRTEMFGFPV